MKTVLSILLSLTLTALAGCNPPSPAPPTAGGGNMRACTDEAKLCPDGSYVARTGPNCEFTPCPNEAPPAADDGNMRMCTQEAKLCPDGSYVGRTGPNCEFAACPDGSQPQ